MWPKNMIIIVSIYIFIYIVCVFVSFVDVYDKNKKTKRNYEQYNNISFDLLSNEYSSPIFKRVSYENNFFNINYVGTNKNYLSVSTKE